jgi:3-oxoacyl-(acyl-carrier-protein) synthase
VRPSRHQLSPAALTSGRLVPGNRNLDNCAEELRANNMLFYPNKSMQLPVVEAGLLKSFGFGQVRPLGGGGGLTPGRRGLRFC